jgi:hypothetical protein
MSEANSMERRVVRLRCWWFGHEQHPQDYTPPDEATCMHCGEYVPYSDMVGDTRHNRAIDSMHRVWWHIVGRWLPHKCHACGERFKCKPDCDGIPF